MGTRNLTAVYKNGKYAVAQYGQWDGYPECAGQTILKFLLKPENIEELRKKIDKCVFVTQEEIDAAYKQVGVPENERFITLSQANKFHSIFPLLNRDIGYNILSEIIKQKEEIKLGNSIDFANDSLFCEWGYVVDLDKNTFEIYEGYNRKPLAKSERFYNPNLTENEYYPIRHIKTYFLNSLPDKDTFEKEISEIIDKEED